MPRSSTADVCYCRGIQDFAGLVTTFLSSCVNKRCSSNAVDVSSAFEVYDDYCSGKGYTPSGESGAVVTATTTDVVSGEVTPTLTFIVVTTVISPSQGASPLTREFRFMFPYIQLPLL
jgi:hypothetical protein